MPFYSVKENQTLREVVADACPAWGVTQVRDHEKNQHLFTSRSEFLLKTGDQIWVPEEAPPKAWLKGQAGKTYEFVLTAGMRPFKIQLNDMQGKPLANEAFELNVDGVVSNGQTDAQGYLETQIPIEGTHGKVSAKGVTKDITIGGLEPVTTQKGIQARLANLGFSPGPIDSTEWLDLRRAPP